MASRPIYRADHIGSLLRPNALLEMRAAFSTGGKSAEELRQSEDQAILEAIALQKESGTSVISDGEFRRMDFRSNFAEAVEGLTLESNSMVWHGANGDQTVTAKGWFVTGKLRQTRRLCEQEADFLLKNTKLPVKICLPSPGFMSGPSRSFKPGVSNTFYASPDEVGMEMAKIIRTEIEALIQQGVHYIQLDNPGYTFFLDPTNRKKIAAMGGDPEKSFEQILAIDIAALKNLEKPENVVIGMHLCRGNMSSLWLSSGGYDAIAEKLFNSLPVDRFLLEYDDERSGDFAPLRFIPKGVAAVLGIISTKSPVLEDAEALMQRIDEAKKYVDEDFLAISPQCGFASIAEGGNALTQDNQRRKLDLLADVARMYWGFEI